MEVLGNIFDWIVLSITAVLVLALAAFIWSDAVADRRRKAGAASPKAAVMDGSRQAPRRAAKRRLKDETTAASQAA